MKREICISEFIGPTPSIIQMHNNVESVQMDSGKDELDH